MSRIGKQILSIPAKTEVKISGTQISVKGPLGELTRDFKSDVIVKVEADKVTLEPKRNDIETKALWGTYASHLSNMLTGVNTLYSKKLFVEGIGFKSDVKGAELVLSVGFSHLVKIEIPKDLKVTAEKNVVTVSGIDIEKVGQFTAMVRSKKLPEPYKGKGIRYDGEVIRRKQGKKTA